MSTRRAVRVPLALAVPALLAAGAAAAAVQVPTDFVNESVIGGLNEPTSFAFLPDGRLLFTEQRTGKIRMLVNGVIATTDPIFTVPGLNANSGERGLLGIAVDPAWPVYPFVYVFYNRLGGIRIVRYLASEDVDNPNGQRITLSAQRVILDSLPDAAGNHNGGTLRFGRDGCLYASLGDDGVHCAARDSTSLRGQILRLRTDRLPIYGGPAVPKAILVPPDNPFATSPDSNARLVYAFGLRNPFRFHVDPDSGDLFVADVGENSFEELNQVRSGDFCGWPWREADAIRVRSDCPEPGGPGAMPYRAPILSLAHDEAVSYAIISAGVYRPVLGGNANWPPAYYPIRGDVFYGQYYEGYLRRLTWDGANWAPAAPVAGQPNATDWATGLFNSVDFNVGPDGSLWWMRQFDQFYSPSTGGIFRIRYVGSPTGVAGRAPAPRALAAAPNPARGPVELAFSLAEGQRVRLGLYDLTGRRVRALYEGTVSPGETRVRWDGTGERGEALGPGVYFARLEREHGPPATTRILRLR